MIFQHECMHKMKLYKKSYWNEKYLKMNRNINNIEHNKNYDFSKINACINKRFNKWKLSKNK